MERNVRYTYIGAIFVVIVMLMVGFVIWIGKANINNTKYTQYASFTPKSVSGISEGTPIRYKGIIVGSVSGVGFKSGDMDLVRIGLSIDSKLAIKDGACVSLETQGIAGASYLSLTQGNGEVGNDELCFKDNTLGEILSQVQGIGSDAQDLIKNFKGITNQQNSQNISQLLLSLKLVASNLEETRKNIDSLTLSATDVLKKINKGLDNGDYNVRSMIAPIILQLEGGLGEMNRFFSKGNNMLDKFEKSPYDTFFGQRPQKQK